jgi:hypothetical protein
MVLPGTASSNGIELLEFFPADVADPRRFFWVGMGHPVNHMQVMPKTYVSEHRIVPGKRGTCHDEERS